MLHLIFPPRACLSKCSKTLSRRSLWWARDQSSPEWGGKESYSRWPFRILVVYYLFASLVIFVYYICACAHSQVVCYLFASLVIFVKTVVLAVHRDPFANLPRRRHRQPVLRRSRKDQGEQGIYSKLVNHFFCSNKTPLPDSQHV